MGKLTELINLLMYTSAPRQPEELAARVSNLEPPVEPLFEFIAWPKTARLLRDIVITEKLDGTNAAILIKRIPADEFLDRYLTVEETGIVGWRWDDESAASPDGKADTVWVIGAQSRNRLITLSADNQGFAKWVEQNSETLIEDLGEGRHFGEFWGNKIGRTYGLPEGDRRFSLFNPSFGFGENYGYPAPSADGTYQVKTPGLGKVPILYEGPLDTARVSHVLRVLQENGSYAVSGFMRPEGIVVYHTHARKVIGKVTLDNQDAGKWEPTEG